MPIFNLMKKFSNSFFNNLKEGAEDRIIQEAKKKHAINEPRRILSNVEEMIVRARDAGISESKILELKNEYDKYSVNHKSSEQVRRLLKKLREEIQLNNLLALSKKKSLTESKPEKNTFNPRSANNIDEPNDEFQNLKVRTRKSIKSDGVTIH